MSTISIFCDQTAKVRCDNCDWTGRGKQLAPISDLDQRIEAGATVPAGECPKCGALAYLDEDDAKTRPNAPPAAPPTKAGEPQAQTRDIGLAIRNLIEGAKFPIYRDFDGDVEPSNFDIKAETIDCGDPDNLIIHLDNGQAFTVTIVAGVHSLAGAVHAASEV